MNIIKENKREYNKDEVSKKYTSFFSIGSYDFYLNENQEVILGGIKLINLHKFAPVFAIHRIKYLEKLSENDKNEILDTFEERDVYYIAGLITLNSLRNFKFTENLNVLNLHFETQEEAFAIMNLMEKLRHIDYKIPIDENNNHKDILKTIND